MNLIILAGNVGGDPRLNVIQTATGPMSVLNFSLAVQTSKKDPQTGKYGTLWVDCSLWGTRADSLGQYIKKGSKLSISGEPGVETYQAQDGMRAKMTCRVSELTLQGSAGEQQQAPQQQTAPQQRPAQQPQQQPYNQPQQGYAAPANQQRPAIGQHPSGHAMPNTYQPQQQNPAFGQEPPIDFSDDIPF
jgi:single-strand DNA-binding protein